MNGENNHIFHTSALDGMTQGVGARRSASSIFAVQAWLLAAFVAVSLVVIAAKSFLTADEPRAVSAVLAVAGVALFPIAWRNVARILERADEASGWSDRGGSDAQAPSHGTRSATQLTLALHR